MKRVLMAATLAMVMAAPALAAPFGGVGVMHKGSSVQPSEVIVPPAVDAQVTQVDWIHPPPSRPLGAKPLDWIHPPPSRPLGGKPLDWIHPPPSRPLGGKPFDWIHPPP